MPRRPSRLMAAGAAALIVLTGCEPKVYGTSDPTREGLTVVVPQGGTAPLPEAAPDEPVASFTDLADRARLATEQAERAGADLTLQVLDRNTGQLVSNGNDRPIAIASVVKLFIADDLLLRVSRGEVRLSEEDWAGFDRMLRSSDDDPAEIFWLRGGRSAIVRRVAERYGLTDTAPPNDGHWWNTTSTAADLVRYYDKLLSGAGGLPRDKAEIILANLAASTPEGIDTTQPGGRYPQRFGIPDGLPDEQVAVKQGWMCCVAGGWMHLSTGVIGPGRRFVMVIASDQPGDAATARATITEAVRTLFPAGRI